MTASRMNVKRKIWRRALKDQSIPGVDSNNWSRRRVAAMCHCLLSIVLSREGPLCWQKGLPITLRVDETETAPHLDGFMLFTKSSEFSLPNHCHQEEHGHGILVWEMTKVPLEPILRVSPRISSAGSLEPLLSLEPQLLRLFSHLTQAGLFKATDPAPALSQHTI